MNCNCTCKCFQGNLEDLRKEIKQLLNKKDNFYDKMQIYEEIEIARKSLLSVDIHLKDMNNETATVNGNKTRIWQAASCLETAKRNLIRVHDAYAKYLGYEE
jgi:hypothetical protein